MITAAVRCAPSSGAGGGDSALVVGAAVSRGEAGVVSAKRCSSWYIVRSACRCQQRGGSGAIVLFRFEARCIKRGGDRRRGSTVVLFRSEARCVKRGVVFTGIV